MMNQIRYDIVLDADCNTEIFVLQKKVRSHKAPHFA